MTERDVRVAVLRFDPVPAETGLTPDDPASQVLRIDDRVSGRLGEDASFASREENVGHVEADLMQAATSAAKVLYSDNVCGLRSIPLEAPMPPCSTTKTEFLEDLGIAGGGDTLLHMGRVQGEQRPRHSSVAGKAIETTSRHCGRAGLLGRRLRQRI